MMQPYQGNHRNDDITVLTMTSSSSASSSSPTQQHPLLLEQKVEDQEQQQSMYQPKSVTPMKQKQERMMKKHVSFRPKEKNIEYKNITILTEDDINTIWYSKKDLEMTRHQFLISGYTKSTSSDVLLTSTSLSSIDNCNDTDCNNGFTNMTGLELVILGLRKTNIQIVLDEQERCRQDKEDKDAIVECLARVQYEASKHRQRMAHLSAMKHHAKIVAATRSRPSQVTRCRSEPKPVNYCQQQQQQPANDDLQSTLSKLQATSASRKERSRMERLQRQRQRRTARSPMRKTHEQQVITPPGDRV